MKKLIFTILAVAMSMTVMAQRNALIKDEGGMTNIRKGPGTNYAIACKRQDGTPIGYKASTTSGWYKVYEIGGGDDVFLGYVAASKVVIPRRQGEWKYVGQVKPEGGYTNIRKGPGTSYAIAEKVKDGSYVLYSKNGSNGWYKVYTQSGNFRGYISASKIYMTESPAF